MKKPTFALLGAAGYIAPRHMDAIHMVGGRLLAACDPHDSVGVLDRYSQDVRYFPEPERFDRWLDKQNRSEDPVDYVVVCTPNYLHDAHCRLAMRSGSNVICEKPVVLTERNLDALRCVEDETGRRVNVVLQLRLHPAVTQLRGTGRTVSINYCASRGPWYARSWKGDERKSGGIVTNIGVHLFDLVLWLYGAPTQEKILVYAVDEYCNQGAIHLRDAYVSWRLSTWGAPRRVFQVDNVEVDMSDGMLMLHADVYRQVLEGQGWGLEDARAVTRFCEQLRGRMSE